MTPAERGLSERMLLDGMYPGIVEKWAAEVAVLEQRLEAAEKWAQAEWHRGNMLAGWAAGNASNAGCDEASREAGIARDRYEALAAGEGGRA